MTDSTTPIYDGRTGEALMFGRCEKGHVYTMPVSARGCPVCDAPNRLAEAFRAAGLNFEQWSGGSGR